MFAPMRLHALRPDVADASLALILFGFAAVEAIAGDPGLGTAAALAAAAAYTLPLALRRRMPLAVGGVVLATQVGLATLAPDGNQVTIVAATALAVYSIGRHVPPRASDAAFAVWALVLATAITADDQAPGSAVAEVIVAVLLVGLPWATGRALRNRAQRVAELTDEAEELRRDRDRRAGEAVAAERARLARELHDVVTHAISVVAVQTQAVRLRLDPAQGREAADLRAVESAARDAMTELRRLLGVLRSPGEAVPLAPQPGLDQLPHLVERAEAAGSEVEVHITGDPVALSPGVDLAAYRVLQEGVTNALRHAPGAAIAITVGYAGALTLQVSDTGNPTRAESGASTPGGVGLTGMRERVALYGGRLDAGARPDGGFLLDVSLPLAGSAH